jgi:hypothetical protein
VADWTVILTTVGAAAVTGPLAISASGEAPTLTKKQIEEETTRTNAQIAAENDRLRDQYREDHLRNRQSTYHALLTAEQALASAARVRSE